MAKGRGGRPRKADGERGTRQIRVFEDIADMLGWVYHFRDQAGDHTSIAQLADPLLRAQVVAMYEPYRPAVEAIKAAELRAQQAGAAAKKKPDKG